MKKGYSLLEVLVAASLLNLGVFFSLQLHFHSNQIKKQNQKNIHILNQHALILDSLVRSSIKCGSFSVELDSLIWKIERPNKHIPLLKIYAANQPEFWRLKKCNF